MDGLKFINDTYGHRAGDAAIREIGQRLRQKCVRPIWWRA
jgi:PleD family two-component response regulator